MAKTYLEAYYVRERTWGNILILPGCSYLFFCFDFDIRNSLDGQLTFETFSAKPCKITKEQVL